MLPLLVKVSGSFTPLHVTVTPSLQSNALSLQVDANLGHRYRVLFSLSLFFVLFKQSDKQRAKVVLACRGYHCKQRPLQRNLYIVTFYPLSIGLS